MQVPYNVEVTMMADDTPREYEVTMAALIEWENHFPDMTWREWVVKQTHVGLAYIGYASIKTTGAVLKPFKEWSSQVRVVRLVPKDDE